MPWPFIMTFDDQSTSEAMDGPFCIFGAITIDIHIIEESYLYIISFKYIKKRWQSQTWTIVELSRETETIIIP